MIVRPKNSSVYFWRAYMYRIADNHATVQVELCGTIFPQSICSTESRIYRRGSIPRHARCSISTRDTRVHSEQGYRNSISAYQRQPHEPQTCHARPFSGPVFRNFVLHLADIVYPAYSGVLLSSATAFKKQRGRRLRGPHEEAHREQARGAAKTLRARSAESVVD